MKGEFVYLSSSQRKLLRDFAKKQDWSKSRVLRVAFIRFVKGDNSELEEQAVIEEELKLLEDEDRRLMRAQKLILKNCAYLQKYVKQLMEGGWDKQHANLGNRRPPLPETPGATLTINALEGIFARRREIGVSVARLVLKCWKGKYGASMPLKVKSKNLSRKIPTEKVVAFPLCPHWAMSGYNRRFEGPRDRKHCDKKGKEVTVKKCWACWNKGMKDKIMLDEDWDSWRKSKEYQELRVFLDTFDFDSNMEFLRSDAHMEWLHACNKKKVSGGEKKHGSNI